MSLPADLSYTTAMSAETPIQDLPCMKPTQVRAGACIDSKVCVPPIGNAREFG